MVPVTWTPPMRISFFLKTKVQTPHLWGMRTRTCAWHNQQEGGNHYATLVGGKLIQMYTNIRVRLVGRVEKWNDRKLIGDWKSGRIEKI